MNKNRERGKIDWMITLLPLTIIIALCILFFFAPEQSNAVLSQIRFFFGDTFGTYYLVIGLGIFILSLYIACSKYGDIVLGEPNEKPQYSFFAWGSMMFTCGLAADILFYSFSEWVLYATDSHLAEMGSIQDWAGVYPLFHWSFIPWGFYLVLAVAFGFMLHVRKRTRQKYSEACRPILGKHTDGWAGRIIDLLAVFALLAGTATTFSVATPLMATIIGELFHVAGQSHGHQYYHPVDHLRRVYLLFAAWLQGHQQIGQCLHLSFLWVDCLRPPVWRRDPVYYRNWFLLAGTDDAEFH